MTARVAHITDVHWQTAPSLARLTSPKRLLGSANLYLAGRRHHFSEAVQDALIAHLLALAPDLLIVSGDLTATALPEEFDKALRALQPVLDTVPTLVIPGNHDVYTRGAQRQDRIRTAFGPWMHRAPHEPIARLDHDEITLLGLDPNRPTGFEASGRLPQAQLEALEAQLPELEGRTVVLVLHYPVVDRHGQVYDNRRHGLLNARALLDVLRRAPVKPVAVLFGHEHHGFRADVDLDGVLVPMLDCGSSGYTWMPGERRGAAMNLYTLGEGALHEVERYLFDGDGFSPEEGGAYATGR